MKSGRVVVNTFVVMILVCGEPSSRKGSNEIIIFQKIILAKTIAATIVVRSASIYQEINNENPVPMKFSKPIIIGISVLGFTIGLYQAFIPSKQARYRSIEISYFPQETPAKKRLHEVMPLKRNCQFETRKLLLEKEGIEKVRNEFLRAPGKERGPLLEFK